MTEENFHIRGQQPEVEPGPERDKRPPWRGNPGAWRSEDSSAYTRAGAPSEADKRNEPVVLRCITCNQRRDSRVEVCKNCGDKVAEIDPNMPSDGRVVFVTGDVIDVPAPQDLEEQLARLIEQRVALAQERAILDGSETPPSAAVLRDRFIEDQEAERARRRHDLDAIMMAGPGSSGKWEANPTGLSGRLVRGYRHWRDKR